MVETKMRMRTFILVGIMAVFVNSCRKESVHHKIMEGLPINTEETIIPGQAIQEFHLLMQDAYGKVSSVLNRLGTDDADYSDLTGPSGLWFSFVVTNSHYGLATVEMRFEDATDTPFNPIVGGSTSAVKFVDVKIAGNSDRFSFSQTNGKVLLETVGITTSKKYTSGSIAVNGQGYSMTFTLAGSGLLTTYQGFYSGELSETGTGPGGSGLAGQFVYTIDHDIDGDLTWGDRSGGVHFFADGRGFINSDNEKFLFE